MSFLTGEDKGIKKHPCLTAFGLSLVMLLFYSILQGIYPFGAVTFLRKDLYHQYLPFLCELRRRLVTGAGLKYSFSLGLGASFYALYVYYLSDPLNLLSIFFPEDFMAEFITLAAFLKISAASGFMCRYLCFRCRKLSYYACVMLSLCYGFSGYIASYDWNVMWMWGIALAPIVILGFEKLIRGEGISLYLVSMAFTVWTNYYIAMIMGEFLILYFIVLCLEEIRSIGAFFRSLVLLGVTTALSAGISAVLLLPEWAEISRTSFTGRAFPDSIRFYLTVPELMLRSLMAAGVETGLGHEPALYASLAILFLLPVFFLNKGIPLISRAARGALIIFFYLSFDMNVPEFIWHGFNYPDSIPARQAFLFIFICISSSGMALEGIEHMGYKRRSAAIIFPVLFYAVCIIFCNKEEHTDLYTWILSALFILLYFVLMLVFIFYRREYYKWGRYSVCLLLMLELFFNFNLTSVRDVSRKAYYRHAASYKELAGEGEKRNSLNQGYFTRFDLTDENIRNASSLIGFSDASFFSSTIDSSITDFYKAFGMKASRVHYMGEGLTPFTSAVMGIGGVIANEYRNNETDFDVALLTAESAEDYLFENSFRLPLGFAIPEETYDLEKEKAEAADPIDLQNRAAIKLNGERIFIRVKDGCIKEEAGKAVITVPAEGHYYAFANTDAGKITEYTDLSEEPWAEFKDMKYKSIMDLGRLDRDTKVTLETDNGSEPGIRLYRLRPDKLESLTERLSGTALTLTGFEDDHIEGLVNMPAGEKLFLALPSSKDWKVLLDGEGPIKQESFYGLFMVLAVPEGLHHISLTYHIPYFTEGLVLSVFSLFVSAVIISLANYLFKTGTK